MLLHIGSQGFPNHPKRCGEPAPPEPHKTTWATSRNPFYDTDYTLKNVDMWCFRNLASTWDIGMYKLDTNHGINIDKLPIRSTTSDLWGKGCWSFCDPIPAGHHRKGSLKIVPRKVTPRINVVMFSVFKKFKVTVYIMPCFFRYTHKITLRRTLKTSCYQVKIFTFLLSAKTKNQSQNHSVHTVLRWFFHWKTQTNTWSFFFLSEKKRTVFWFPCQRKLL